MPAAAGEDAPSLRKIEDFGFSNFHVTSTKAKRRKASSSPKRAPTTKSANSQKPIEGFVYLLQAGQHFKIGKSVHFEKRLGQIKLQLPWAVEVVHTIRAADALKVEAHWHRRFTALRRNGEWFLLTEAEVAEFKSVSKM